ncbi:hypothetical protein BH09MYX1_BH09MYX1_38080 [soil metagenome]
MPTDTPVDATAPVDPTAPADSTAPADAIVTAHSPAKGTVRLPRKEALWAFLAVAVAAEIAAAIARSRGVQLPPPAYLWPVYVLAPILAWSSIPRQKREGRVRVDAKGVTLDGAVLAKQEELSVGLLRREGDATWLRLSGKNRWAAKIVDVAVDDGAEADKILTLLGLDAKSRTAIFHVFRQGRRHLMVPLLGMAAFGVCVVVAMVAGFQSLSPAISLGLFGAFMVGLTGAAVAAVRAQRATVVVGVDGLRIDEGFKKPRFIPHDRIRNAEAIGGTLSLTFVDGTRADYRCAQKRRRQKADGEAQQLAEAIVVKIVSARAAFDELSNDVSNVPALARARRSPREWLDALRAIADGEAANYRDGTVPRERLLRVAESAHAPETDRLAAAVALAGSASPEEKERLRALAKASASPAMEKRFRIAIESDGSSAMIEQMLEEAYAEEKASAAAPAFRKS